MKTKLNVFFRWLIGILAVIGILGGCGLISNLVWQAMGTTVQQVVLGVFTVGFVYYCVLPIVGLTILAILLNFVYLR